MIVPTKILSDMVRKITSVDRSNVMFITMSIYSSSNPVVEVPKCTIEHLSISKKFSKNTTNEIQVKLKLYPKQLITLVKNQADLLASVVIEYVDSGSGEIIFSDPPEIATYRLLIHNPEDLAKKYGANTFENTDPLADPDKAGGVHTETLLTVDMQLLSPVEYQINKAHYHGMLSDTTIEQAIRYVASNLGASKLNLIPPDNTALYKHINIPPEYGNFNQVFEFLQHQYGIYSKGLCYYVDNETLFIYPAYETKLERQPKLTILKVGEGAASGSLNHHELEGKNVTFVCDSKSEQTKLASVATENEGNSQLFMKADTMIDGQIDHKTMMIKDTSLVASNKTDSSIQQSSAVARYSQPTINLFSKVSKMASGDGELLRLGWTYCRTKLIEPGMPCTYVFDEKDTLVQKYGIVESIDYTLTRSARKGEAYTYAANAELTIRSEIAQTNYSG